MSISNSDDFGQIQWYGGLIEGFPYRVDLAGHFPFIRIKGRALRVNQMAQMGSANLADILDNSAAITLRKYEIASSLSGDLPLGELATRINVSYTEQDRLNAPNDLLKLQSEKAKKALQYMFYQTMNVSLSPYLPAETGKFITLPDQIDTSMDVPSGGGFAPAKLREAIYKIRGRANAIISNSAGRRAYEDWCDLNGVTPETIEVEELDPVVGVTRLRVPSFNGIRWFINDLVPTTVGPPDTTDIWVMIMGAEENKNGVQGVVGLVSEQHGMEPFRSRRNNDVTTFSDINEAWSWSVGLAVLSKGSLARVVSVQL